MIYMMFLNISSNVSYNFFLWFCSFSETITSAIHVIEIDKIIKTSSTKDVNVPHPQFCQ